MKGGLKLLCLTTLAMNSIRSMSPKFLTIAYYTKGTSYESLSQNLSNSCKTYNIPLILKPIEDLGSWEKNTHYKSEFIAQCLEQYSENLLYVDVDAIFRSYPDLINNLDCDIAYRTENFRWRSNEALSGTIFLKNSNEVKELVSQWSLLNKENPASRYKPETWEQANLQRAVLKNPKIRYYNLPPEYTYITDHTRRMYPGLAPIIEHFQESRNVHKNKSKHP